MTIEATEICPRCDGDRHLPTAECAGFPENSALADAEVHPTVLQWLDTDRTRKLTMWHTMSSAFVGWYWEVTVYDEHGNSCNVRGPTLGHASLRALRSVIGSAALQRLETL